VFHTLPKRALSSMNAFHSSEYQIAAEEAANAFMKVMALRGFSVRDYPQNFVAHLTQQTRLHFASSHKGAHPEADTLVSGMLTCDQPKMQAESSHRRPAPAGKTIPFPAGLRRRAA
jgi:hypothetical protein